MMEELASESEKAAWIGHGTHNGKCETLLNGKCETLLNGKCEDLAKSGDDQLDRCFEAVKRVALAAGELIREAFYGEKQNVLTKSSMADLVTETDHRVEQMIVSSLQTEFPTHCFIGEESTAVGQKCILTNEPTWIIDPIDGTTNFVHRFPFVAISIALLVKRQAVIGLIYNPVLDLMYLARPGQGSFCNGRRLHVNRTSNIGSALVCAEFGSSRDPLILDAKLRSMRNIISKIHGMRAVGSAALHMCFVASGDLDAHFTYGIHIWDMAAGDLIVREAGGTVVNTDGGPLDLLSRCVLCACTNELAQQVAQNLEQIHFERD